MKDMDYIVIALLPAHVIGRIGVFRPYHEKAQ